MADPLDRIVVLRQHLEEVYNALDWCRIYITADQVHQAARECKDESRDTRLLVNINRGLGHISGYLVEEENKDG
jgi:recombinational DNA repair protein RecR